MGSRQRQAPFTAEASQLLGMSFSELAAGGFETTLPIRELGSTVEFSIRVPTV